MLTRVLMLVYVKDVSCTGKAFVARFRTSNRSYMQRSRSSSHK
jgi:hypothetical protein